MSMPMPTDLDPSRLWTLEEYLALPDELFAFRPELVEGRLEIMNSPARLHQRVSRRGGDPVLLAG